jgi:hypothetical protein
MDRFFKINFHDGQNRGDQGSEKLAGSERTDLICSSIFMLLIIFQDRRPEIIWKHKLISRHGKISILFKVNSSTENLRPKIKTAHFILHGLSLWLI